MVKSTVFSPWSRTVIPFPSLWGKYKPFKAKVDKQQCGIITMPHPTFLPLLSLNINPGSMLHARPGLGGLTKGIGSTLKKRDRYNTCDSNFSDWNKLDIIQPTPKRLCNRTALIVCSMLHIPPQLHQTGLGKTGMGTKQKPENRGHLLTLN